MNELDTLMKDILAEVEKTSAAKSTKQVKTSSVNNLFSTKMGSSLHKLAQLCRELGAESEKLTYKDVTSFLGTL